MPVYRAAMHTFQKEHPLPLSVTKEVAFNATLNKTEANASVTQSSPSNQELNPLLSDGQTPLDSDTASEIATNHLNDKYQIPHYSDDLSVKSTNIITYTAIEKREGLTAIARRLLRDVPLAASVSLQKTLHSSDRVPRASAVGLGTVALSAFMLNALGNPSLRRVMVKEMWDSGADVLVSVSCSKGWYAIVPCGLRPNPLETHFLSSMIMLTASSSLMILTFFYDAR